MTIDQKLVQVMNTGTATAAGDRIFRVTAKQRTDKPYAVLQLISERPIHVQEGDPLNLRDWSFQLSVYGNDLDVVQGIRDQLVGKLTAYQDEPRGAGIQRVSIEARRQGWSEGDQLFTAMADLGIMESLP